MPSVLEIIINGKDNFSKEFSASLDKIGQRMTKLGGVMSAAVTAPLVALGTKAVMAASDFEESLNKVQVVFGEASGTIESFAATASTNLGMSSQQALEAAGTFGNLFTAMGIGVDTSATMSTSLLQLASDLASFNNMDPTVVLEKLRAGLVGEVEPLRTLGVNLNQATIEAKALELGIWDGNGAIDAAAKAQAAYAIIMEQTTNAQGDFARTSDGLANSTRILKGRFEDTSAQLGQILLPFAKQLIDVLQKVLSWVQSLTPAQQKLAVVIAAVAAAIGPLLIVVGTLISSLTTIIPIIGAVATILTGPLGLAIAAIVAAITLFTLAWKNDWLGIRTTLTDVWENKLKPAFEQIKEWLEVFLPKAVNFVKGVWEGLTGAINGIGNAISSVIGWFQKMIDKIKNIHLPSWLTPGSPTPFEMGLRGIADAMKDVNNITAGVNFVPGGLGGTTSNISNTTNKTYNITFPATGQTRGSVLSDIRVANMLYG